MKRVEEKETKGGETEISFVFEERFDEIVSLKPEEALIYHGPESLPLAKTYQVFVPPELIPFKDNIFVKGFFQEALRYLAGGCSTIEHWSPEAQAEIDSGSRFGRILENTRFQDLISDSYYLSRRLSDFFVYLTPQLRDILAKCSFDFNGARVELPPINDQTMPNLWMARFFEVEEKAEITKRTFPSITPRFLERGIYVGENGIEGLPHLHSQEFRNHYDEILAGVKEKGVFTLWIGQWRKELETPYERDKKPSLAGFQKVDWPNASYAVDREANTWHWPILVVDSGAKIPEIYRRLERSGHEERGIKPNVILCVPRLGKDGLPGISGEVVAGPLASKEGFLAMVPGEIPDERFNKFLAYVLRKWTGLEALDYYTVSSWQRAFYSFQHLDEYVFNEEDREVRNRFYDWVKNYRIEFVDPVSLDEYLTQIHSQKAQEN